MIFCITLSICKTVKGWLYANDAFFLIKKYLCLAYYQYKFLNLNVYFLFISFIVSHICSLHKFHNDSIKGRLFLKSQHRLVQSIPFL